MPIESTVISVFVSKILIFGIINKFDFICYMLIQINCKKNIEIRKMEKYKAL